MGGRAVLLSPAWPAATGPPLNACRGARLALTDLPESDLPLADLFKLAACATAGPATRPAAGR